MVETHMSSSLGFGNTGSDVVIKISTLTIIVAIVSLFLAVIFAYLLYLYAQRYWGSRSARRRAQLIFAAGELPVSSRGLDPAVLSSLPITLFKPSNFQDGLECAVCLSELTVGEEARLLPKCNHGFHLECIDMWFESHTTCPICRRPVDPEASGKVLPPGTTEDDGHRLSSESPALPTNILFWGNPNQASLMRSTPQAENSGSSSSSEGRLVISIPVRSTEGYFPSSALSPLPSSRSQVEELKSPLEDDGSPAASKLRSLRRLLSRGKRTGGSSGSSPRIGDIEQALAGSEAATGVGGATFPKSPKLL